jgi:NADH-quinone oxidoreductase subunit H
MRLLHPAADVSIGVLWVLAISSLGVYGVVLAGYSSNNKYSLMGGLRASAQLISYELAMGMAVAAIVLATGSLSMLDIVRAQQGPLWGVEGWNVVQNWYIFNPFGLVAAVIFAVCIVAETNRAPFDLPEAENELIAGYHTEYSSMKFAVFFMGEYAAMFLFSGVFAALFLGGFNMAPVNWLAFGENSFTSFMNGLNYWLGPIWFLGKCFFGITVFIWLRATLPRLRYDQLMNLGWRSLLPIGVANFLLVAVWIMATSRYGSVGAGWIAFLIGAGLTTVLFVSLQSAKARKGPALERRTVTLVDPATPKPTPTEVSAAGS